MKLYNNIWGKHISGYPSPKYLNYNWGLGSALGLMVALQALTGVMLAAYYRPSSATAFADIVFIQNEVNGGYLLKYMHLNGATLIFALMYLHLFRAIFYRSYILLPKVWFTGMILFLLMIITAFLGYVLPWGQMSYWAATVITNLVTSIPFIGQKLIVFIHGAFSVQSATLNRFFVLHFLLAIIILVLIILHISSLHREGSTVPAFNGVAALPKVYFYYYFVYKDIFFFLCTCFVFFIFVFLYPNVFNHPDNFNEANPFSTPSHIVPEWYFLPFYAILRAIPNKLLGVMAMLLSIVVLFALPFSGKTLIKETSFYNYIANIFFYGLVFCYLVLGYLGSMPAEAPYVGLSQLFTFFYFILFFIPFLSNWVAGIYYYLRRRFNKKANYRSF